MRAQKAHPFSCETCSSKIARLVEAGATADLVAQLPTWEESGVFTERERAALELAEAFTFIHEGGIPDELYDRVGGILSEKEYTAISWLSVSINAFNRVAIAGRYAVPPLETDAVAGTAAGATAGSA
jgi:alkylhydroperoxidase family enzyme